VPYEPVKRSPDVKRAAERMAPGVLSKHGFLGSDPRRLEDILDADASAVAGLGTTHEAIAAELGRSLADAEAATGTSVAVDEHLHAVHTEVMGRIPCPFGRCGTFQKGEANLTDDATGETLRFTALSVHMIGEHGFYEGRGSCYRVEPAAVFRMCRMKPTPIEGHRA
jgi:hypothetical protein